MTEDFKRDTMKQLGAATLMRDARASDRDETSLL